MPRSSALRLDLAAQIAELIRVEEQPAHTPLREEGLAARLGVSRTPIRGREILQRSGHVYYKENAGVFVAPGGKTRGQFKVPAEARPADALYRKILADRGRRALGDTVSEAELLARYKVPRSLLSRVLIRIHGEGFIERRRGHGWEFQPLLDTPQAIAESFRFRAIVESAGLLEAGFRLEQAEVKRVRERHRRFIAAKAPARTAREFFDMNARFHEMLAQGSGNRFLLQSIEQIDRLRKFQEFASFTADSGALVSSCREHPASPDALEVGAPEWAAGRMRRHLQEGRKVLVFRPQAGTVRFAESTRMNPWMMRAPTPRAPDRRQAVESRLSSRIDPARAIAGPFRGASARRCRARSMAAGASLVGRHPPMNARDPAWRRREAAPARGRGRARDDPRAGQAPRRVARRGALVVRDLRVERRRGAAPVRPHRSLTRAR